MKRLTLLLLLAVICLPAPAFAQMQDFKEMRKKLVQKQQDTRSEIQELNEQISQFQERLNLAEQKYDRLYKQYEDLQRIVALQEEKINKLQEEQSHIKEEIVVTEREIVQNRENLDKLIEHYKKTLRYIYKHGRTSQLALIFSSASINQMLVRSYYIKKFEEYREEQARTIEETQEELERNKERLEQARKKNAEVLAEIQSEKKEQEKKKRLQEKNVALLRKDRQQIRNKLDEVQKQKEKLNNTLTSLILEEERVRKAQEERIRELEDERKRKLAEARGIENETERAREVAKYSEPVSREGFLGEEELNKIETSFAGEKGSLPWPVESGTISEHFGRKRHPVYGTVTPNLGIEIVTNPREPVHTVHDGYVVDVLPITGYGDVILVSHGKFITAYGNLSQVMVSKRSVLQKGDIVGLSGDEDSARGQSVFFMVRESNTNLDPEKWLSRK